MGGVEDKSHRPAAAGKSVLAMKLGSGEAVRRLRAALGTPVMEGTGGKDGGSNRTGSSRSIRRGCMRFTGATPWSPAAAAGARRRGKVARGRTGRQILVWKLREGMAELMVVRRGAGLVGVERIDDEDAGPSRGRKGCVRRIWVFPHRFLPRGVWACVQPCASCTAAPPTARPAAPSAAPAHHHEPPMGKRKTAAA